MCWRELQVMTVADRSVLEQVAPLPSTELLFYPKAAPPHVIQAALGAPISQLWGKQEDALRRVGEGQRYLD